jgi:hypothetical protein
MKDFFEKKYKVFVVLVLSFMFIVSALNAKNDSLTFDEKAHIPAGYSYLTQGDYRLNPEHPPLIKDLSAIPLLFLSNVKFDTSQSFWATELNETGQWNAGNYLLWKSGNDADMIIFWARFPIIIISLVLGYFIFKWVREIAGTMAGLFALVLYAFDPNVLGHNHFVTTDLGIAAFMTFSFYYFLKFVKDPTWKNVFVGGVFLGLVQLAKFSSIMLFPIFGLVLVAYPLCKLSRNKKESVFLFKLKGIGEYLGKGAIAFTISMFLVWVVYLANTYNMPREKMGQLIEFYFPQNDSSPKIVSTNKVLTALNDNSVTRPLSTYGLGMSMVFKRVSGGNGAYFMGQVSGKAFIGYFPTVFLLKETIFTLILLLIAIGIFLENIFKAFFSLAKDKFKHFFSKLSAFLREEIVTVSIFLFIALYSYISITGNLNIGFRHLFPIVPFVFILAAVTLFRKVKKQEEHDRYVFFSTIIFLSALLITETISVYPYYMSYFNQTAGGPKYGYRFVTDSNADWGQDLKRLKSFVAEYNECYASTNYDCASSEDCIISNYWINKCDRYTNLMLASGKKERIDKIRLNYFGGADPKYYLGDTFSEWWDSKRPIETGWYAISTNFLQGSIYDKEKKDEESYRWIKNIKPDYRVGTSILIYYITEDKLQKSGQKEAL